MAQRFGGMATVRERFQWGSYGLIVGIVIGAILGWLFNRVIGTILWVGLVVAILVLAFTVWRWVTDRGRRIEGIVDERREAMRGARGERGDGLGQDERPGRDDAVEVDSYVIESRPGRAVRTEPEER